ncbi:hypothetical protein NQ315_017580 [Exocentrus adspersus]|uniref:RNase H type-1 domain-containing protein n=1 Tax=Exocentrus adspersus TaxID=1586481 RepID=A0AAV8VIT8_9CUCU|nr:hypothetical protein NQ315_017580 [Exocentrus adspersus]
MEIFSDASLSGWGAACNNQTTHGLWNQEERKGHINKLELTAVWLTLCSLANKANNCEILLRIDNTTAVSYVNKIGGIKYPELNQLARNIWQWAERRNIWLYASYISSADNVVADKELRVNNLDTEWELSNEAFSCIVKTFGRPIIDLFARAFRLRPTAPKYKETQNTDTVLNYLEKLPSLETLTLKALSKKLVTLLALITAHRAQTLSLTKIENISISDADISIKVPDLIKTSGVDRDFSSDEESGSERNSEDPVESDSDDDLVPLANLLNKPKWGVVVGNRLAFNFDTPYTGIHLDIIQNFPIKKQNGVPAR